MPTPEELSAQVADLTSKLEASNKEADKQKGIAENAEKLVQKWSNEVGELRKQAKESADKQAALEKELEELKQKISGSTTQGKKTPDEKPETADDIEKSLDEAQRKAVEAAYAQADEEVKARFHEDQQFRLEFLKTAKERVKVIPADPWKKPESKQSKKQEGADSSDIGKLFDKVLKRERFTPPGGNGSAQRSGLKSDDKGPRRIVVNGGQDFLGQLKSLREEAGVGA